MKLLIFFVLMSLALTAPAQPNCDAYLYKGDTLQYKACKYAEKVDDSYYQFSPDFQHTYDEAIKICPYYAYAYREKSVAYLKSGDFCSWKKLIDLAVKYDTIMNLGYRGWCRFQFFRDYKGAIEDVDLLTKFSKNDVGVSINGDYHLNIMKGICYSALGQKEKAIAIMVAQLNKDNYAPMLYDYYQVGVTYFELGNFVEAMNYFDKQSKRNELAENVYYKAKVSKQLNRDDAAKKYVIEAKKYYQKGLFLFDPYTSHYNKVYFNELK